MEVIKLLPIFAAEFLICSGTGFWFYGNDHTPIHIHVKKGDAVAKYNILPISIVYNHGFKPSELKMIEAILEDNEEIIAQHWNTFFNNAK